MSERVEPSAAGTRAGEQLAPRGGAASRSVTAAGSHALREPADRTASRGEETSRAAASAAGSFLDGVARAESPRRERTRELIMDAAFDLFAERGVNGSTVVQICERAGFTRGAFYSNFSTKEELCLAVLRREAARHLAALQEASGTLRRPTELPCSPRERVRQALRLFLTSSAQDPTGLLVRLEMQLHALRVPSFRRPLLLVEAELVRAITAIMEPVVAALGLDLAVPARQLVRQLYATYDQQAAAALMCGRDLASDATADALLAIFTLPAAVSERVEEA